MAEKYFYALGRRKTSTATVRLFKAKGKNTFNGKAFGEIYKAPNYEIQLNKLFETAGLKVDDFYFTAKAKGGGTASQFDALKLAIARALVKMDESLKPSLKAESYLTRDSRKVERKKAGFRKARKKEQFSKR